MSQVSQQNISAKWRVRSSGPARLGSCRTCTNWSSTKRCRHGESRDKSARWIHTHPLRDSCKSIDADCTWGVVCSRVESSVWRCAAALAPCEGRGRGRAANRCTGPCLRLQFPRLGCLLHGVGLGLLCQVDGGLLLAPSLEHPVLEGALLPRAPIRLVLEGDLAGTINFAVLELAFVLHFVLGKNAVTIVLAVLELTGVG
mmetsp:Transcript_6139/g.15694  ORF Transcript_6139/g.15694 Transcript_6139/m.15694 type:complete len:200 (-) Transcript_6139:228-827(-)